MRGNDGGESGNSGRIMGDWDFAARDSCLVLVDVSLSEIIAARRAALARVTLILTFSHEGRRDPPVGIHACFRVAGLAAVDAG